MNTFTLGDPFISSRPRLRLHAALGAVVAGLVLTGGQAKALTVNVNSQDYNVTTFPGSYNDNVIKFTTADMPWWGNAALAREFATQYALVAATVSPGFGLGSTSGGNFGGLGPFFAINLNAGGGEAITWNGTTASIFQLTLHHSYWAYAIASPAPPSTSSTASVPGPLPALGLAVAFGFSRQLRKRIKASARNPPSTSEA